MEAISVIATQRGTTEEFIVNNYTYRQFQHIATSYLKDKFMIVRSIFSGLNSDNKKTDKPDGLPSWYKSKPNTTPQNSGSNSKKKDELKKLACVIDLDGPLESLSGYVGGVDRQLRRNRRRKKRE